MATPTVIQGDVHIVGNLTGATVTPSSSTVTDASVSASAAISASKIVHQQIFNLCFTGTAVSGTYGFHIAYGAGTIVAISAASVVAAVGAATVTVDLKKGGSSVLSAVIQLDSGNTARTAEAGTISTPSYSAGNFFEIVTVATAGGGTPPTGLIISVIVRENPNP